MTIHFHDFQNNEVELKDFSMKFEEAEKDPKRWQKPLIAVKIEEGERYLSLVRRSDTRLIDRILAYLFGKGPLSMNKIADALSLVECTKGDTNIAKFYHKMREHIFTYNKHFRPRRKINEVAIGYFDSVLDKIESHPQG